MTDVPGGAGAQGAAAPSYSEDRLLGGNIVVKQPLQGHRAGTDAILLAAAAGSSLSGSIVDLGAGVGTAGIAAAVRSPIATLILVDSDPVAAACARDNLRLNGMTERGRVSEADIFQMTTPQSGGLTDGEASLVLTNPPFFTPDNVRASPQRARAAAHVMPGRSGLEQWIRIGIALLRSGGRFVIIHRAEALAELLPLLGKRLGGLRILPVYPRADAPGSRVVISGILDSRAPLRLLPGLTLHEADGRFTAHAQALSRGAALLDLD